MASDVDICNLSLSFLGDVATVASIDPPSGDAQSSHCSRFYPIARDSLLEMHTWGFATTRISLALSAYDPPAAWSYAYSTPNAVINYIAILDPDARDDYSVGVQMANTGAYAAPQVNLGVYTPQNFVVETGPDGADIIYTNMEYAVLRYTQSITDTTKFTPLFTIALARLLASMLAGPLLKGDAGSKESANQMQHFQLALAKATGSDSNQRHVRPAPGAPWMANR